MRGPEEPSVAQPEPVEQVGVVVGERSVGEEDLGPAGLAEVLDGRLVGGGDQPARRRLAGLRVGVRVCSDFPRTSGLLPRIAAATGGARS